MKTRQARIVLVIAVAGFAFGSLTLASSESAAPKISGPRQVSPLQARARQASAGEARSHGLAQPHRSPALRTIPLRRPHWYGNKTVDELRGGKDAERTPGALPAPSRDGALQKRFGGGSMPVPIVSFNGVSNRNGLLPPDTNGDIGPNHYLQIVNVSFAVYNRDGTVAYGPQNNNVLFTGTPLCGTHNQGDPVVLYDQFSGRWLASQFATGPDGNYECVSVSATSDPTGSWCGYEFLIHPTKFGDYPKFGVWPTQNAFFMTVNQFDSGWGGVGVYGFERDRMLACEPARFVYKDMYDVDSSLGSVLPADADGSTPPPAGAAIPLVAMRDGAPDRLSVFSGTIDWSVPSLTVTHDREVTTTPFSTNLCGGSWNCIPQPSTTVGLEPLSDRLMHRLAYRNFGGWQSMVVDHTVTAGSNRAGIRWYELTDDGSGWGINQQGTYAPTDGLHRWMGSIAQDSSGNMALGYSVSSSTTYPSIRYTGRLVTDPPGTLPQGEESIMAGAGSQLSTSNRWGDYSAMTIDPNDDCTFWYTQEYYSTTGGANWRTRIGAFRFPRRAARRHLRRLHHRHHRRRLHLRSTTSTTTRPAERSRPRTSRPGSTPTTASSPTTSPFRRA